MEEKVWLKNYPEGVPHEIDPNYYNSLIDMFKQSVEKFKDLPAYESFDKIVSYDEVDKLTDNFAAFLQTRGLKKGRQDCHSAPKYHTVPHSHVRCPESGTHHSQHKPALHLERNAWKI